LKRAASLLAWLCEEVDDLERRVADPGVESKGLQEAARLLRQCEIRVEDARAMFGFAAMDLERKTSDLKDLEAPGATKSEIQKKQLLSRIKMLDRNLERVLDTIQRSPEARSIFQTLTLHGSQPRKSLSDSC